MVLGVLAISALLIVHDQIVYGLLRNIKEAVDNGIVPNFDSLSIAWNLEYEKQRAIVLTGTGVLFVAAIFGYLVTRIALIPTRRALETQKQFVGNIAHEIRTPLSIIKTNTEVTLFDEKLDADTRTALQSNLEELDRISDIINNFLSMNALLQPGKTEFTNVDLNEIIKRADTSFAELKEHKRITLTTTLSHHRHVWGNASGIEQIVLNVIKNALIYTPQGGTVRITTEPTYEGEIELTVEDTGVGIAEQDLTRVFEPFYRGDRSRNRKSGGSGLGLAIVSELVKLHKGRITIQSMLGSGTTVRILLPAGHSAPKSADGNGHEVSRDFSS